MLILNWANSALVSGTLCTSKSQACSQAERPAQSLLMGQVCPEAERPAQVLLMEQDQLSVGCAPSHVLH